MKKVAFYIAVIFLFVRCSYKNIPFQVENEKEYIKKLKKSPEGLVSNTDTINLYSEYRYAIRVGDELTMQAVGIPLGEEQTELEEFQKVYKVNSDGEILLPLIGFKKVAGLTLREASREIEEAYKKYYTNPKVDLYFHNLKVFVYKGSQAAVVQLNREQTHLSEVIAAAGGLEQKHQLKYVKIIRGDKLSPVLIWVDLRKEKTWEQLPLYVQADDVIYVKDRDVYYVLQEIRPYLTTISLLGSFAGIAYLINILTR